MTLRGVSRMLSIRRLSLASAGLVLAPLAAHAQVPTGWQAVTDGSGEYAVSADVARRDGGQGYAGASIKANVASPRGSAMLAQSVRADAYRGKRVRLTGFLKTIGVNEGTAVLFMRVDGDGTVQTSDFMENRPLMLTTDWARQEIVLDVPRNAVGFTYGFMLGGSGQAWLDDVQLEVVSEDVPTTGQPGGLYPTSNRINDPQALERRRREQEVAYRRAASSPVNLALHRDSGRPVVVTAARNAP